MGLIEAILIAFAVGCLLAATGFGLFLPRSWIWNWADPIYYPLAILGVILLFISSERARQLSDLRADRAAIVQVLEQQNRSKPTFKITNIGSAYLKTSYEFIAIEANLGKTCREGFVASMECVYARDNESAISAAFNGFDLPPDPKEDLSTAERINDYCRRGFKLIDSLEVKGGFQSAIFSRLKESFAEVTIEKLNPGDIGFTQLAQQSFSARLSSDRENYIRLMPLDRRDQLQKMWDIYASFSSSIYSAFSMCLRIPESLVQNLKEMAQWEQEHSTLLAEKTDVEGKIQAAQSEPDLSWFQLVLAFILAKFWPFALVAALALKFAKGVASLRARRP
jgi:hypothetical protein